MKKITFVLFLTLVGYAGFAQRVADEVIKMNSKIEDLTQNTITGIFVIKEGNVVKGISPETKAEVWSFDADKEVGNASVLEALSKVDTDNLFASKRILTPIDGTPYVEALVNYKTVLINTIDGKVVYNSANYKYTVFNSQFLYAQNEYLVKGVEDGKVIASLIDLNTGNVIWKTEQGEAKSMFASMFTFKANMSNEAEVSATTIYSLYFGKLSAIDRSTGALKWVGDLEYTKVFPTQNNKNLVVVNSKGMLSTKQYLNVLDTETGKPIWEDAIKTKYIVYLEDWGDKILVAHNSGFNFFNLKDGSKVWKKDARGDGLKKVISIDGDYLYVAENEMMLIDKDGQKKWKNFIEISDDKEDAINYLGKVDDKVLYLTATYGNMVDYKSGKKLWRGNLKFDKDRPLLNVFDEEENQFLVYNDEKLYKFNTTVADKPDPFAKVNIKKEKELNSIELFSWGVALSGPTEVMGVSKDGKVLYQKVYTQPGDGGRAWGQALSTAGSIGLGVSAGYNAAMGSEWRMVYIDPATGQETPGPVVKRQNDKQLNRAAKQAAGAAMLGTMAGRFSQRFDAMRQNRDFSYIFAKDEASKKKVLVKVKKEDGTELDKILFENMRPIYEIDPATQSIYYIFENELRIFNKKI
ncbi:PQQ-binding-like beta-propeller repeat protein [Flavobacterium sp. MC2016-06]|uniref:outer membrane protein assembly factor BamB family protein n=1 Tax=Flavobacterium sp. MC2016-06 TaxID=2676308 RepID=UPI0012BB1D03|nr:PQQ-binding-like beta-propeller repeat protein [Flavobacterium sp. MC2016-06]MBU3858741.1 PQQ-like beta-propeller repeat protein [Flavobacterium sp. MC2016-06]